MKKKINAWIARDKDGTILPYKVPPQKDELLGYWTGEIPRITNENLPEQIVNQLTWESEPIEVEIIVRRKGNRNIRKRRSDL
jgi:hypothetical protein